MKDKRTSKKYPERGLDDHSVDQRHGAGAELVWRDTALLLQLLVSRVRTAEKPENSGLINNLQLMQQALTEGVSLVKLQPLIKDINAHLSEASAGVSKIYPLESAKSHLVTGDAEQVKLICDVFVVLLDNINFPSRFRARIDQIKSSIASQNEQSMHASFLTGITDLAEVLDDIFDTVKQDKKNIEKYLRQLSSELKSLDDGILTSNKYQSEKVEAEKTINSKVETEVLEMENNMNTMVDLEEVKTSLQKSLGAIRVHMESFKQEEARRNQQASEMTDKLSKQLFNMEQECQQLKKQILEKHEQVLSDPLTGVRNRFAYDEAIKYELERFRRYARPVSLLVIDLDKFKDLNDKYGHNVGDKALKYISGILAKNLRGVDFLARYGGDEFVIILPELTLKEALATGHKICKVVEYSQFEHDKLILKITISGGIAQLREDDTVESLFERADEALYLAKQRGRNRCEAKPF